MKSKITKVPVGSVESQKLKFENKDPDDKRDEKPEGEAKSDTDGAIKKILEMMLEEKTKNEMMRNTIEKNARVLQENADNIKNINEVVVTELRSSIEANKKKTETNTCDIIDLVNSSTKLREVTEKLSEKQQEHDSEIKKLH